MITPHDIQNKVFARGVRGYKEEEVDGFLDLLTADYERVIDENDNLKRQLVDIEQRLSEYRETEESVLATLEAAKALMNDISASAEKRAEILVKNAELDAELLLKQSRESLERLKEEELELSQRVASVRARFKSMLETELDRFDVLSEELFGSKESVPFVSFSSTDTQPMGKGILENEDLFKTATHIRSKE